MFVLLKEDAMEITKEDALYLAKVLAHAGVPPGDKFHHMHELFKDRIDEYLLSSCEEHAEQEDLDTPNMTTVTHAELEVLAPLSVYQRGMQYMIEFRCGDLLLWPTRGNQALISGIELISMCSSTITFMTLTQSELYEIVTPEGQPNRNAFHDWNAMFNDAKLYKVVPQ